MKIPNRMQRFLPDTLDHFSISAAIQTSSLDDIDGSLESDDDPMPPEGSETDSSAEDGTASATETFPTPAKEDGECSSSEDDHVEDPTPINSNGKHSRNTLKLHHRRLKRRASTTPAAPQLRHLRSTAQPQPTAFESVTAPHTKNGYIGPTHHTPPSDRLPDLHIQLPQGNGAIHPLIPHLQAEHGFSLRSIEPGERTAAFESSNNRKIFLLRTQPSDASWQGRAMAAVETLFKALRLPASAGVHRQGHFFTAKFRFSHGNGRTVPGNWVTTKGRVKAWQDFLATTAILNIMNYIAVIFWTWAPKLFQLYADCQSDYLRWDPTLRSISSALPFSSITVNFGPGTICHWHHDVFNLVFGWCVIWALGNYDAKYGGHLILWEPRLIVEFAPGDIIFLPSACITHANIPIREGETRYSITWYSAGGLFRYRADGFQSADEREVEDPVGFLEHQSQGEKRWMDGWDYFSSLDELKEYYACNNSSAL